MRKEQDDDESAIRRYISKQPFKSVTKLFPKVKSKFPYITRKLFNMILKEQKIHDLGSAEIKNNTKYMNRIYNDYRRGWFYDIFDNKKKGNPRYFLICIGGNDRYAAAYPLNTKSTKDVLSALKKFVSDEKVVSLTSDDESAFHSKEVLKFLDSNGVDVIIITESRHTGLGTLDRFVRTLRDMAETKGYGSTINKYQMAKLLKKYNDSTHNTIGVTPTEMHENKMLELQFIGKQQDKQLEIQGQEEYKLKVGDKVRTLEPKKTLNKKRYKVSPGYYVISDINGVNYTVSANDGTVKTVSRFMMFPLKSTDKSITYAHTIPGTSRGSVTEILKYDAKKDKYRVKFEMPDGEGYIDTIPASYLRGTYPNRRSDIELEFWRDK